MKTTIVCLLVFLGIPCFGQNYISETGKVRFFSSTLVSTIEAANRSIDSRFNSATGEVQFTIVMKDFDFKKSLMKEHFNDQYLETKKYPQATFSGKLVGFVVDKSTTQQVRAIGKLTIHGVTREIDTLGQMEFIGTKLVASAKFKVALKDHKIKIPQLLWKNLTEMVDVNIELNYKAL